MKYACWRCDHEIPGTALTCSGCGKPLAPFPWLRNFILPPRKQCDAVIADFVERVDPLLTGMIVVVFAGVFFIGVWLSSRAQDNLATASGAAAEVRTTMEERGVPVDLQDVVFSLLDERETNLHAWNSTGHATAAVGLLGTFWILGSFIRGRRLLAALRSAQEALGSSAGSMAPPGPGASGGE